MISEGVRNTHYGLATRAVTDRTPLFSHKVSILEFCFFKRNLRSLLDVYLTPPPKCFVDNINSASVDGNILLSGSRCYTFEKIGRKIITLQLNADDVAYKR